MENETRTIRLADPLPCCLWAEGGVCGKPAYVAYAWEAEPQLRWPLPGLWTLQPVCAECAAAAAKQYTKVGGA
jgi:hypothetical protein